jgi:ferredoxin
MPEAFGKVLKRGRRNSVIVVDEDKCIGCGLCVKICHEHCITLVDEIAHVDHDLCSTCTQCIAMCPQQALSWDGVAPVPFDKARLPSPEQLDELFKERRTVRFFKRDKLDRALVQEIVSYGIYAPTNNYDLRAVVVDDGETISELDRIIVRFVGRIYRFIFKPRIMFSLIRMITPALDPKDKVKMERDIERGQTFNHPPPVTVFIVGDRRIGLSEVSAQYALYNMILYAQSKGIGSRLKGTGPLMLDRSRTARERLGLQKHEHILGTLELGHPAVTFANKVKGKTMGVEWIEGQG